MTGTRAPEPLLAPDALADKRIAISASESPDLARLGLEEIHFRLALAEIARAVLVSGGKLSYGGHLASDGYTSMLIQELHRYSRRDKPLQICLVWQEHRKLTEEQFDNIKVEVGLHGEIVCLDPDGIPFTWKPGNKGVSEEVADDALCQKSLSALRKFMTSQIQGRVLIGGRRHGYQGRMPGLVEEATMSLQAGQPLYLAGAFGGVTLDIIKAIGLDDGAWFPARADIPANEAQLLGALDDLTKLSKKMGPDALANGLSVEENRRLAATYRPSEIAALISLGLGRRFTRSKR